MFVQLAISGDSRRVKKTVSRFITSIESNTVNVLKVGARVESILGFILSNYSLRVQHFFESDALRASQWAENFHVNIISC